MPQDLPGVNVLIKGSRTGVQTNLDGKYSIKAKIRRCFSFLFVGMTETTKQLEHRIQLMLQ
jgi:hypothetical protein